MAITVGSLHSTIMSEIPYNARLADAERARPAPVNYGRGSPAVVAMRQVQPTEDSSVICAFAANYGFGILSVALIMAVPLAT